MRGVLTVDAGDDVEGFLAGAAQGVGELGRCLCGSGADMGEVSGWVRVFGEGQSGGECGGPGQAGGVAGAALGLLTEAEGVLICDVFVVQMEA